jgi:poly(A) polymerase
LRTDVNCNGRHAQVIYSKDWQLDAARRDFTINALSCDLAGNVYDYFSGIADLATSTVKFIGTASERILEDHLRILRYFRFCALLAQKNFHTQAIAAIKQHAACVNKISGERLTQEFFKLLQQKNPLPYLEKMQECGLMAHLFGACPLNYTALKNMIKLDENLPLNALRRFAALISKVENLAEISQRFKLSNKNSSYLKTMLCMKTPVSITSIKENLVHLNKELTLDWVIIYASMHNLSQLEDFLNLIENWPIPIFPLTGEDLIIMNISGKKLGQLLKKAKAYWQEQNYQPSKAELLSYILY